MTPGVLVAWSGTQPQSRVYPVPEEGIVLGRDLLAGTGDDDRISRQHARIMYRDGQFWVVDLESRNKTHVDGIAVEGAVTAKPLAVVRTGRTISVLFEDTRWIATGDVGTRRGLIAGRRMAAIHDAVDAALGAGAHVVIAGNPGIGRGHLARTYAAALVPPLRGHIERDPMLDIDAELQLLDMLATTPELRLVITRNRYARPFPDRVEELLTRNAHAIAMPPIRERADELAAIIFATVRAEDSAITCHASLFEYCLLEQRNMSDLVAKLIDTARTPELPMIRADDFIAAVRRNWAIQGFQ